MHSVIHCTWSLMQRSAHTLRRTNTLTFVGLFLAIQMVLSSYGVIQVSESLKISLAHLALAPTAMLFGPVAAGLQGALSDILGFLIRPTGPYFPGFTFSALLGGVIYGLLFYGIADANAEGGKRMKAGERITLWRIVLARVLIVVFLNICLNTLFLTMLYGPAQMAALPVRALKNIVQLPVDILLLHAVIRTVKRIAPAVEMR